MLLLIFGSMDEVVAYYRIIKQKGDTVSYFFIDTFDLQKLFYIKITVMYFLLHLLL